MVLTTTTERRWQLEGEITQLERSRIILIRARERITNPERWCQGHSAVAMDGGMRAPIDSDACAWCAVGAICVESVLGVGGHVVAAELLSMVIDNTSISLFNDTRTHAEVLHLFDSGIRLADLRLRELRQKLAQNSGARVLDKPNRT